MGRRGPARTPTAMLKLSGSWRGKKREKEEPKPNPGIPDCPEWLSVSAKAVWDQVVPQLHALKVLSKIDVNPIARYCEMFVRWREAEDFIAKRGSVYPLKDGNGNVRCLQQFPQVSIANKLAIALLRIEQEFGLTPSARARISVPLTDHKEENELDRWNKKYGRV